MNGFPTRILPRVSFQVPPLVFENPMTKFLSIVFPSWPISTINAPGPSFRSCETDPCGSPANLCKLQNCQWNGAGRLAEKEHRFKCIILQYITHEHLHIYMYVYHLRAWMEIYIYMYIYTYTWIKLRISTYQSVAPTCVLWSPEHFVSR